MFSLTTHTFIKCVFYFLLDQKTMFFILPIYSQKKQKKHKPSGQVVAALIPSVKSCTSSSSKFKYQQLFMNFTFRYDNKTCIVLYRKHSKHVLYLSLECYVILEITQYVFLFQPHRKRQTK